VRRETVLRYDRQRRSNAAKVFPGSEPVEAPTSRAEPPLEGSKPAKVFPGSGLPERSSAAAYREVILEKLDAGLNSQRIWQDLVEEYGYSRSYESVKRFIRALPGTVRPAGVIHAEPGEEAQVDFFQGAPTLDADTGQWRRPWVFRMTLAHSRHGYEEAV
jgi:hypothetical protein